MHNFCTKSEVNLLLYSKVKCISIFRSERKDDPNNYSSITILPMAERVMERLIYDYFSTKKLLNENQ